MKNILVIEDYPDNMMLIVEILEDEGYGVLEAETAEIGLSIVESDRPDLILMDISLPKMSGLEATEILKANPETASIPIIALTAHAMKSDKDMVMAAGCNGYMTKPIDEELLLELLKDYLK